MNRVLAVVAGMVLAVPALAQDIRWINPAGGNFSDAANWEGGAVPTFTPPTYPRPALFDLDATYTVNVPGGASFDGFKMPIGNVTLNTAGALNVGLLSIGTVGGPRTHLHMTGGAFTSQYNDMYRQLIVTIQNADVTGMGMLLPYSGGLHIQSGSDVQFNRPVYSQADILVDATSTLHINASVFTETFVCNGPLYVSNTWVSFDAGYSAQSTVGVNAQFGSDSMGFAGVTNLTNCIVGPRPANFSGQVMITGPASSIKAITMSNGVMTLRNGAQMNSSITLNNCRYDVGPDCYAGAPNLRPDSIFAWEATTPVGEFYMIGRMELTVDGLNLPTTPHSRLPRYGNHSGTLQFYMKNANALRIGNHIPLFSRYEQSLPLPTVILPTLPGGRALQLNTVGLTIYLDVVAGGTQPCWTADFNGDEDVGTDQDIEAFFACLAGNCCATCGTADFNGDGDVGTDGDIEAFFRVLAGAAC